MKRWKNCYVCFPTWLANMVMVKKVEYKMKDIWENHQLEQGMHDDFPIPQIDQIVNNTIRVSYF